MLTTGAKIIANYLLLACIFFAMLIYLFIVDDSGADGKQLREGKAKIVEAVRFSAFDTKGSLGLSRFLSGQQCKEAKAKAAGIVGHYQDSSINAQLQGLIYDDKDMPAVKAIEDECYAKDQWYLRWTVVREKLDLINPIYWVILLNNVGSVGFGWLALAIWFVLWFPLRWILHKLEERKFLADPSIMTYARGRFKVYVDQAAKRVVISDIGWLNQDSRFRKTRAFVRSFIKRPKYMSYEGFQYAAETAMKTTFYSGTQGGFYKGTQGGQVHHSNSRQSSATQGSVYVQGTSGGSYKDHAGYNVYFLEAGINVFTSKFFKYDHDFLVKVLQRINVWCNSEAAKKSTEAG